VRGSRFLAQAVPAVSRGAVDAVLRDVRLTFPDASHLCYAYRLAADGGKSEEFSTDAGEPGGSAGVPVLNALRQRELVDALLWVVRYFGGTKLGIPGLIDAYGRAACLALESAAVIPWIALVELQLQLPYTLVDRVKGDVRKLGGKILTEKYASNAAISCQIPAVEKEDFLERLEQWGGGMVTISMGI
jgi:uncharacterized YigZ family protein